MRQCSPQLNYEHGKPTTLSAGHDTDEYESAPTHELSKPESASCAAGLKPWIWFLGNVVLLHNDFLRAIAEHACTWKASPADGRTRVIECWHQHLLLTRLLANGSCPSWLHQSSTIWHNGKNLSTSLPCQTSWSHAIVAKAHIHGHADE